MSILVICPGCHKRFTVSDKFAGKSGPCPNCKTTIRVPAKQEEVKIHEPRHLGASVRGAMGSSLGGPIARKELKLSPVVAAAIGAAAVVVLLVTWILGRAEMFAEGPAIPGIGCQVTSAVGLLLVSPPLVIAGYSFLRDEENLEPYQGMALYVRAAVCSLAYVLLWGVYGYVAELELVGELWTWLVAAPVFLVLGAAGAWASLDLDFGAGFFHYCFYVLVTMLLRWLAGLGWVWEVPQKALL